MSFGIHELCSEKLMAFPLAAPQCFQFQGSVDFAKARLLLFKCMTSATARCDESKDEHWAKSSSNDTV